MSQATSLLASGFDVLLGVHGETFSYTPSSDVVLTDWGEAVQNEEGAPVLGGNVTAVAVTLIFDAAFLLIDANGGGQASKIPVARGRESDLSGIRKNAVLVRSLDSTQYVVQRIEPDGLEDGVLMLILSKQVH